MRLETLQRTMAAAVMMPLTRDDTMRATTPDGQPMAVMAEGFVAPNSRLTAFERLEIYNQQYWFRVKDALREDFSALAAVVGEKRFDALAVEYLTAHPSRSFTLRNLGSRLVEWLAAHPVHAGRRVALALDVARMEWAHVEAFDAADAEPLTVHELGRVDGESRLGLQPHLRLLALEHAVEDLVIDVHRRNDADKEMARVTRVPRRKTWLAVHRAEHSVFYRRLERAEFGILRALGRGAMLAEALEEGFAGGRWSAKRQAAQVQAWFAHWAEMGWLCAADALPARGEER